MGNQALDVPLLEGRGCYVLQKADRYRQRTVGSWNNAEAQECSWKGHLQERDKVVAVLAVVAAALAKILPRTHLWVKVTKISPTVSLPHTHTLTKFLSSLTRWILLRVRAWWRWPALRIVS